MHLKGLKCVLKLGIWIDILFSKWYKWKVVVLYKKYLHTYEEGYILT